MCQITALSKQSERLSCISKHKASTKERVRINFDTLEHVAKEQYSKFDIENRIMALSIRCHDK